MLQIKPLTPAIGAEIHGADLTRPLDAAAFDALYAALIEHQVIFFREQAIAPAQHLAFARGFGEPQPPHPFYPQVGEFPNIVLLHTGVENPPHNDGWHTDLTFQPSPPFATILWAKSVPDCGGDTLWASLCRAYDTLPAGLQNELADMSALHDMGDFRNDLAKNLAPQDAAEKITAAHQKFGGAIHPLVKTHPISARKFLFVNESFTQHIIGMRATDSNKMLAFLYHHIDQPENQVRFKWSNGALAMWDNRCTWHYATADYLPQERIMHRITVTEDARVKNPGNGA